MPSDPPILQVMLSIFDLKPRHEEKAVVNPAPEQSGPVKAGPPPLPAVASDAIESGAGKAPEAPPVTESVKSTAPATTSPEPVKKSDRPEASVTAQSLGAATSSEATKDSQPKVFQPPKGFQRDPRANSVPVSEPVNIPEAASTAPEPGPVREDEGEFEVVLGRRQIASWLFVGTVLIAVFSAASYFVGKTSAPNCVGALADQTVPYIAPPLPAATIVPPGQEPNLDASANQPSETPKSASVSAPSPAAPHASAASAGPALAPASVGPAAGSGSSGSSGSLGGSPGATASVGPVAGPATPIAGPPALIEPPIFAQPQPGALYLQMGAVDKGVAVVLAEGLRRQGFTSLVAPGPTDKIFRVLIGPLENQDAYRRVKAQVNAIDLSTFARRFQK